ncbi:MAG: sensor histidine kinase [Allosphingosinicella sp.]|uniref:sensor histidine kinase n=1 Tax=Allosphingosinicella sp. TaxID=2823234 RepID=UPI00392C58C3
MPKFALRRLVGQSAFRPTLVLWCFGYLLVDIAATLQGRSPPLLMLVANLPLLAVGVGLSLLLAALLSRLEGHAAVLRWGLLAIAVVAAGALQTLGDFAWLRLLALTLFPGWQEWALSDSVSRIFTIYLLYTWTFALALALIWSMRINDLARLNEARAAAFEAAASRAEAAALRLQLNPHFLFNTLNGIASLVVRKKSAQAEEMIGRLADFLRASLAADPFALVPLDQELRTIRSYLHVEEARFGDRLSVRWRVDEEAREMQVPNFILQPLVENAIKHAVAPARSKVAIDVEARQDGDRLVLVVANEGGAAAEKRRRDGGEGVGLKNCRERLQRLYGPRALVDSGPTETGYRCEIRLPLEPAAAELAAAQ